MTTDHSDPPYELDDGEGLLNAGSVPTREDVLDVNFNAIVATCRAIVHGTCTPRSWEDVASTWGKDATPMRAPSARWSPEAKKRMVKSARRGWRKRKAKKVAVPGVPGVTGLEGLSFGPVSGV